MSTLLCLGLGYCAEHYVAQHGTRFTRVVGTTRTAERAAGLAAGDPGGRTVEVEAFDGVTVSDALRAAAGEADALLVSAAPDEGGDPGPRAPRGAPRGWLLAPPRPRAVRRVST